jgi:hypothetical protein
MKTTGLKIFVDIILPEAHAEKDKIASLFIVTRKDDPIKVIARSGLPRLYNLATSEAISTHD